MVHALKLVHELLRPGGRLVNILSLPVPHMIAVHAAGKVIQAGWVTDRQDFAEERSALGALAQIVAEGDFQFVEERDFIFNNYAEDLPALQDWLADWWESAILPDVTLQRAVDILQQVGPASKVVISSSARMTMLSAL